MAASSVLPLPEMSQCCRCGLQAVQRKLLPCSHTFCLQCLESEGQRLERSTGGHIVKMACPVCSTEFMVPLQGLRGLPPDISAERPVKMQSSNDCVYARVSPETQRVRFDTRGKQAWGVSSMNKYIYILTEESVFIYDPENPSKPVDEIDIPDKKYLTDIAASPVDRCLYVTDQGEGSATIKESCIWKVELDTRRISQWLKVSFKLLTLSVSLKGYVIVPMSAKDWNKLIIYSTIGSPMKAINLPPKMIFPNHAIELANGMFVVVFGKSDTDHVGVCEINDSGDVVRSFCGNEQVLNHPWHVTVFAEEDILLADSKNNRVLWLDSRLKVKKELLTKEKDGIIEPRRICYAKENNLLMIVHSEDGKRVVDLYDCSRWLN